jgi:putative transposase
VRFSFIDAEKASYPVRMLCRVLDVSPSGYYAWRKRPPSPRAQRNEALAVVIADVHRRSRGTYGSPRVHAELQADGFRAGRHRIARLMRCAGIVAVRRARHVRTTDSTHKQPIARNLLKRDFAVDAPNRAWATDITYVRTWEGWVYLAVVIDLFSRRVVGWAADDHMRAQLPLEALAMALRSRHIDGELVHHSDRGSQYASDDYRAVLRARGIACSMSRRGNCWDNAVAESFFATLKTELIDRVNWATRSAAIGAIEEYIRDFYNRDRRHSYLGYLTPAEFEQSYRSERRNVA